ncbi:MAG: NfeD family protein, partial [Armatimonadetes bacterium]|nr:NfeD family protein [Armatimonadota bacterium]
GVTWLPWLVFAAGTSVLLWLGRGLASRFHGAPVVPSNVDSVVGATALVIETIDPVENTGLVRIGSDEWRARAGERIEERRHVVVEAVEGTTLIVRAAADDAGENTRSDEHD